MDLFKKGLIITYRQIKKHNILFISAVLLQLILVVAVLTVGVHYQLKILENMQQISVPLESANYNTTSLEAGSPFMMMKEFTAVTNGYQQMVQNLTRLLLISAALFLFVNGLIWSISGYIVKKGSIIRYWTRFAGVSIIFLVPLSLLSYYLLKSMLGLDLEVFSWGVKAVNLLVLITGYFLMVAYSMLERPMKDILKDSFRIGIKKIGYIMVVLLIIMSAILAGLLFVYFSIDYLVLMILSVLVMIVVLVLTKIYWVSVMRFITHEDSG